MIGRHSVSAIVAFSFGSVALWRLPFPVDDPLLRLVAIERPVLFLAAQFTYDLMWFTTPFIGCSVIASLLYIFMARPAPAAARPILPPYPVPARRKELFVILGEVHHQKVPLPSEQPRWLALPERGLHTGVMVLGAIGSGKTTACMYPFAKQVLTYQAQDPTRRIGGLVLEVKGDFCHQVRQILAEAGRPEDYLELSLETDLRYNPLHNDLDAYALAYSIASLLTNLFGKSHEPFWQLAYTNLVKFVILLHQILDGYVTLFDVYRGAIDPSYLESRIKEGEERALSGQVAVSFDNFIAVGELEGFPFERLEETDELAAPRSRELLAVLERHRTPYRAVASATGKQATLTEEQLAQFDAVKRWFEQDWMRMDVKLRTAIVEGVSTFLSLFDDNPTVKRIFCPPKETYDTVANGDGRYGRAMPPLAELIEQGKVCALNLPVAANPGLARAIATLLKQDFQRAVLNRIARHATGRIDRHVLFLCDEYHLLATVGENNPNGDEAFLSLSRQAKCIPIVATHSLSSLRSTLPGESWRTLVQTFRTKIFLTLADDFTAKTASELSGREEQLKPNYSLSEQGQDAGISMFTGRAAAHKSSIGATQGYSVQREVLFEPKVFTELKNAQAIVFAYDGASPQPPTYLYLKPHYLDPNVSYFEHVQRGAL